MFKKEENRDQVVGIKNKYRKIILETLNKH